jgi:hypothetical protein
MGLIDILKQLSTPEYIELHRKQSGEFSYNQNIIDATPYGPALQFESGTDPKLILEILSGRTVKGVQYSQINGYCILDKLDNGKSIMQPLIIDTEIYKNLEK